MAVIDRDPTGDRRNGYLSRLVLEVISEAQFRIWSRYVIGAVSTVYLIEGVVLL